MLAGIDAIAGFVSGSSSGGGTSGSFEVPVSPTFLTKTGSTHIVSKTLTTAPATVTPSGGSGVYTYAWNFISGDVEITAISSASASTNFSATLAPDDSFSTVFSCVVTDSTGTALTTAEVRVTMTLVST